MNQILKECLKNNYYTQGFAARPLFMYGVPSLDTMKKPLGFTYDQFLISIKHDYCEFNYLISDFSKHAQIIINKLKNDKNYLSKQRKYYENEFKKCEPLFLRVENNLSNKTDYELMTLAHGLIIPLELTVGVSHLIEGISLRLEHDIRRFLDKEANKKVKNIDFSTISSPTTQSFLSKKEELLWKIRQSKLNKKDALINKFLKEFFWIQSSYVQNNPIAKEQVIKMAEELTTYNKPHLISTKQNKKKLFKKYSLTKEQQDLIYLAEFLTDWQDERKTHIYRGIHAVSTLCREISKRFRIEENLIHYLLLDEFEINGFEKGTLKQIAEKRYNGVIIIKQSNKREIFSGNEFIEFEQAFHKKGEDVERLNGVAANLGTATGPVRICNTLESLTQVKQGDILVASMTRPEYISAMKKASAIVTDEGGITCHAAIVSRELNIPCVVGTKIATKTLQNGWIVEVKANHGQVIVLEKV